MNKNKRIILTIITILVSTMLFVNKSYAAKELTCIYDRSWWQGKYKMLVQSSNGSQRIYLGPSDSFDSKDWVEQVKFSISKRGGTREHSGGSVSNDNKYKYEVRSLNIRSLSTEIESCPKYIGINDTSVTLSNIEIDSADDELLSSFNKIPDTRQFYRKFYSQTNLSNEITNTEWNAKCKYGKDGLNFTLYFNDKEYIVDVEEPENSTWLNGGWNKEQQFNFSVIDLNELSTGSCPTRLYNTTVRGTPEMVWILNRPTNADIILEFPLIEGTSLIEEPDTPIQPEPTNCEELFGEELVDKINSVMNIIKIAVPILLIAFGIFDFSKAMFASNDDDMKKAQKTFLKRIVAAFIVFLSPMIINLILSLTNKVWSSISTNTCIKEGK